jgi:hypothetical protein
MSHAELHIFIVLQYLLCTVKNFRYNDGKVIINYKAPNISQDLPNLFAENMRGQEDKTTRHPFSGVWGGVYMSFLNSYWRPK